MNLKNGCKIKLTSMFVDFSIDRKWLAYDFSNILKHILEVIAQSSVFFQG